MDFSISPEMARLKEDTRAFIEQEVQDTYHREQVHEPQLNAPQVLL